MNGKIFFLFLFLLLLGVGGWYVYKQSDTKEQTEAVKVPVKYGDLKVEVTATGELQAKNSVQIRGPQVRMGQLKILDLIKEGTMVKKGDFIAQIDQSELEKREDERMDQITGSKGEVEQVRSDTSITLSKLRDQIKEMQFSIVNKEKEVNINIYEPKEVQDRIQSDLEKLQRDYDTAVRNYEKEVNKAEVKVAKVQSELRKNRGKVSQIRSDKKQFTVKAPSDGMVIYARNRWTGVKTSIGTTLYANSIIANLPDLTVMVSETFINEIDINRIKIGLPVTIKIDALPDNQYTGKVIDIGNIGQQRPNFDAKVFDIKIEINERDSLLRPAMTTANTILTQSHKDVTYIPLESLHSNEEITYVFMDKNGATVRQEVITGSYNDAHIIVKAGVKEGEEVYHSIPENPNDLDMIELSDEEKKKYQKIEQPASATPDIERENAEKES